MKWIERMSRVLGIASGIGIAIILAVMCAELVARNLFNAPILGANEVCTGLYVIAVYLGFAYTQRQKGHIAVELFYVMFKSHRIRRVLDWSGYCIADVLFLFFSIFTWKAALESLGMRETYLSAFRFPVYPIKLAIAVGMTMLFLQLLADTARLARPAAVSDAVAPESGTTVSCQEVRAEEDER